MNERLAALYGLPGVVGAKLRKVTLPKDSVRGGFIFRGDFVFAARVSDVSEGRIFATLVDEVPVGLTMQRLIVPPSEVV